VATSSVDGYLDNLDWTNFNTAYNNMIVSAAVTGTTTKTLTLTQQDAGTITASWTDDNTDAVTSVFGRTGAVVATEGDYSLTQLSDVTITTPSSGQVLKYNGTAWINDTDANTGTVTSVGLSSATSGVTIGSSPITTSGTITLAIATASGSQNGLLSSTDWTTFNNKQSALTNPVTGTGTTNYLPKFTGTSTIGNSLLIDQATYIESTANMLISNATTYRGLSITTTIVSARPTLSFVNSNYAQYGSYIQDINGRLAFGRMNYDFGGHNETMTLDNSGNLGLGVTPSAWSLGKAIEFGNIGNTVWGVNATQFNVIQNAYYNDGYFYASSNAASYYQQSSGAHTWYNAPSGTANTALTFTTAMTLFSTGNLGVGVGGTDSGYKLDVNGTGRFSGALTGTSATFSGGATFGSTVRPITNFAADLGTSTFRWAEIFGYSINLTNNATISGTLGVTGAATFSSSVTATQFISNITNGYGLVLNRTAVTTYNGLSLQTAGTAKWFLGMRENLSSNNYIIYSEQIATDVLKLDVSTGAATFSGALSGTSATFSGLITSTVGNGGTLLKSTSATTGLQVGVDLRNTGGVAQVGVESSVGGTFVNGSTAYASIFGSGNATAAEIQTNGTVRLSISSTGAATFSSSVNAQLLTIQNGYYLVGRNAANTAYRTLVTFDSSNKILIGQDSDITAITLGVASEAMRITSGGNVGIGTSSPQSSYKLTISGTDTIFPSIYLENTTNSQAYSIRATGTNFVVRDNTSGNDRITLTNSGNVGIGTSNPLSKLDVTVLSTERRLLVNFDDSVVTIKSANSASNPENLRIIGDGITFNTGSSGSGTQKMVLTNSGNVGIGTSSPNATLSLYGASTAYMNFRNSTNISSTYGFVIEATGNESELWNYASGYMRFGTANTERMRITSGGKVNINNTSNTNYQLYVDGGSSPAFAAYSTSPNNQFKLAGTAPGLTINNTITSPTIGGALGACTSANDFITGTAAGDMILINQFTGNKLYITNYSGGVYLTQGATSWTANSDIRIKNINSHITNAVEKLSTLQTINFCYKDDISKKENLGLIAQEVEMVFPELIETNNDGILGVRYTELIPVLIEAIKEQQEQIKELKLELDKIKNK